MTKPTRQQELALFNPVLASKPQVVVLNKIDLPDVRDRMEELKVVKLIDNVFLGGLDVGGGMLYGSETADVIKSSIT